MQLRREFGSIVAVDDTKALKNEWSEWSAKIVSYAKLEARSRPALRTLLENLEKVDSKVVSERGKCIMYRRLAVLW